MQMSPKFERPDHETQQLLLTWFSLSREQRRKFDWESKNTVLYRALIPLFFQDVQLQQIVIPHSELNDRFNKFFASSFKMKIVNTNGQDLFNLNELFLFTLDQPIEVWQASKKHNTKIQCKSRRFSAVNFGNLAQPWRKIQHSSGIIKLMAESENQQAKVIYADKNIVSRFRIQILKDDDDIKNNFICQYLFCCTSPSFSLSSVSVQRLQKGHIIRHCDEKIYLIYDGSVIQQIVNKKCEKQQKQKQFKSRLNEKWKFQLVKGSIICKNNMKQLLSGTAWTNDEKSYVNTYILTVDSIFLTISYNDFSKILKNEKNSQKLILEKIRQSQGAHQQFINRSLNAQSKIRQSQNIPVQLSYSIPRNKKTKAFRKKTHGQQNNFDEFVTFDRYQKMTQNKQNIQKKHLVYSQLSNLLRQKQKQDRFIKKLSTAKGMKEIKRCEYMARLKQNKIQNLAIKDSIMNAERYRDRPHEVKFIFEQQMMDKLMKQTNNFPFKRHKKKFISMVESINDDPTQSRVTRPERFESEFQVNKQSKHTSKFLHTKSNKMMHCESTPNFQLLENSHSRMKNKGRIGSALNLHKGQSSYLI